MITHRQLIETVGCTSFTGTKEVFEVDWRVTIGGSQGTWLEVCMACPMRGGYGSSVSPRQAQHCFCHPYNSRCCCHQQKNKQVDGGGDFLHKSEMKVRSGRERFSVQLVTSTELCSTKLYQGRELNIFFGFLTTVFPLWTSQSPTSAIIHLATSYSLSPSSG